MRIIFMGRSFLGGAMMKEYGNLYYLLQIRKKNKDNFK